MTRAYAAHVIEFFLSDPVIFAVSAIGLVATSWSIVRDARSQRARAVAQEPAEIELPRAA